MGDGVVDHHHRHRRAADDVERATPRLVRVSGPDDVASRIAVDERRDPRLRNADEHDRLGVLVELGAGDPAGEVHPDEDMDRLAGIADGGDHVGVEEDMPRRIVAAIDRRPRRGSFDRAEAVGARHEVARLDRRQRIREKLRGARRRGGREDEVNHDRRHREGGERRPFHAMPARRVHRSDRGEGSRNKNRPASKRLVHADRHRSR